MFFRSVDEDLRPFAMGLATVVGRLLGQIPGPVLTGSIIDNTCKLWSNTNCDSAGVCKAYDLDQFSKSFMIFWMTVSAVAGVFFLLASVFAARNSSSQKNYFAENLETETKFNPFST